MRILVVSDYSINELGGAQVMAQIIRNSLISHGHEAIFLHYPKSQTKNLNRFIQALRSIINPYGMFLLLKAHLKFRPDLIWFHGVNNEWSWSSVLVGRHNLKKFFTFHDLTAISNYKITPEMLERIKSESGLRKLVRDLRVNYIKQCTNRCTQVGIGPINSRILRSFKFRIDKEIENRIEPCSHNTVAGKNERTVLFAGRSYMKGLPQIAQAVALDSKWKLVLAGGVELLAEALLYCPTEKVTYLGRMSREDLLEKLHEIDLVSVCSQYYDNYPTIALEAIVHDSLPFTTELTGVALMLGNLDSRLVIRSDEIPNLEKIYQARGRLSHEYNALKDEVSDLNVLVSSYLEIIESN